MARASKTRSRTRSGRIERSFSRLGMVAASLLVVGAVIAIDVALTRGVVLLDQGEDEVDLLTRDGRELGWSGAGLRLNFTPLTLYENRPGQSVGGYRINSLGLRGREVAPGPPDRPRVVVVGGSAAFGLGTPEEGTLSAALEKQVPKIEAVNGGVLGYLSSQELAHVIFNLLDLEPSVIVALDGWNDLYDRYWWEIVGSQNSDHRGVNVIFNSIEDRLARYRRVEGEPSFAAVETGRAIVRNSTLLSGLYRSLRPLFPKPPEGQLGPDWPGELEEAVATYVANMTKLRDVARSRGSHLIVVVQPELGQVLDRPTLEALQDANRSFNHGDRYWAGFPSSYRRFRQRVVRALAERGVDVVDGSEQMPKTESARAFFVDPVHLSPRGYAQIARAIRGDVQRRLDTPFPGGS